MQYGPSSVAAAEKPSATVVGTHQVTAIAEPENPRKRRVDAVLDQQEPAEEGVEQGAAKKMLVTVEAITTLCESVVPEAQFKAQLTTGIELLKICYLYMGNQIRLLQHTVQWTENENAANRAILENSIAAEISYIENLACAQLKQPINEVTKNALIQDYLQAMHEDSVKHPDRVAAMLDNHKLLIEQTTLYMKVIEQLPGIPNEQTDALLEVMYKNWLKSTVQELKSQKIAVGQPFLLSAPMLNGLLIPGTEVGLKLVNQLARFNPELRSKSTQAGLSTVDAMNDECITKLVDILDEEDDEELALSMGGAAVSSATSSRSSMQDDHATMDLFARMASSTASLSSLASETLSSASSSSASSSTAAVVPAFELGSELRAQMRQAIDEHRTFIRAKRKHPARNGPSC